MMQKTKWFGLMAFIFLLSCSRSESQTPNESNPGDDGKEDSLIGKTLPDWQAGYLDIHAINTGRGESTLLIFPDGTTMLVDAASSLISPNHEIPPPAQKPNRNVTPGMVITDYAKHFIKPASNKLDYMMLSHFHEDHMGGYSNSLPMDPTNSFRMGGVTEIGTQIPIDKIIDRGYPDYNYPSDMTSDPLIANYMKFINWAESENNVAVEQFSAGRNDQVTLQHNGSKYPEFKVQNVVGNGEVWTGSGTDATNVFPSVTELLEGNAPENIFSLGFVLSYGEFDYFTGGDLQYGGRSNYSWKDIEAPIANVVHSVDVMKANHHGTANCNGDQLLRVLKPHTIIAHVWRDVQPNPNTIERMYDASKDAQIFTTNLTDPNKLRLAEFLSQMKATQGHIVVRVKPGGDEYTVYVLNDNNQEYKVKAIYGPYQSSKN